MNEVATEAAGAALVAELERRFAITTERVLVGDRSVMLMKPRSADELISEDDFARDERLPYWADLWPSGRILAAYVRGQEARRQRLLELGCGLGLVTLAAMSAGFDVLATDYYGDALRFTRANVWRALHREPVTRYVDWRALPTDLGGFDRVVAADVLYERPYAALVAAAIARTLAPGGEALVADPGRVAAESFVRECESLGLHVTCTEERPYAEGTIRQRITIRTFRRVTEGR